MSKSISQMMRLPRICPLCCQYHLEQYAVCGDCQTLLTPLGKCCQVCALPMSSGQHPICGHCIRQKPYFDRVYAGYQFTEPLRALIHEFKYHEGLYLTSFLTQLILDGLAEKPAVAPCLLPVPTHRKRLAERGYNHAAELTKCLAKRLQFPYDLTTARKIVNTANQASLSRKARSTNLQKAFSIGRISFAHVVIVDDLLTTGSTVNELARLIKIKGVERVDVYCCARAIMD
ncbi:ComF family protein [Legionella londiniensis]|nr:ComF family protein [Legionella londiniensis]